MNDRHDEKPRQRHAVWYRPGRGRWAVAATAETRSKASDLMFELMAGGPSGDWCVAPADRPPAAWSRPALAGNQGPHSTR